MKKPKTIQINIPQPCHEDWNAMTPNERGRLCAHCQKTVVDFTTWSDSALYDFFLKDGGKTCGRFTNMQLNHDLIPLHKPHNWWFRIAVTLGITSLLSQIPNANAQNITRKRTTVKQHHIPSKHATKKTGRIIGQVSTNNTHPLSNIHLHLFDRNNKSIATTSTDSSGYYHFNDLQPGNYYIIANDSIINGYEKKQIPSLIVIQNNTLQINININSIAAVTAFKPITKIEVTGGAPIMFVKPLPKHIHKWNPFNIFKRKHKH